MWSTCLAHLKEAKNICTLIEDWVSFFFFGVVTNDHRFNNLKQLSFMNSLFCRSETQIGLACFSAQGFTKLNQGIGWHGFLLRGFGRNCFAGSLKLLAESVSTAIWQLFSSLTVSWRLPLAFRGLSGPWIWAPACYSQCIKCCLC